MAKLRVLLFRNGHTEHDFKTEADKPLLGEIISYKEEHYEVRFIQHVMSTFRTTTKLDYILVTAIRNVAEDKGNVRGGDETMINPELKRKDQNPNKIG